MIRVILAVISPLILYSCHMSGQDGGELLLWDDVSGKGEEISLAVHYSPGMNDPLLGPDFYLSAESRVTWDCDCVILNSCRIDLERSATGKNYLEKISIRYGITPFRIWLFHYRRDFLLRKRLKAIEARDGRENYLYTVPLP